MAKHKPRDVAPGGAERIVPPAAKTVRRAPRPVIAAGDLIAQAGVVDVPETFVPPPIDHPVPAGLNNPDQQALRRTLAELSRRRCETLRFYQPLPIINAFHADRRDERLLRGSNRAGKTLGAAIELARAVTGQDPFEKYPKTDGRAALVGLDGRHCGDVLYRKLFRPGALKMILDADTEEWRAFSPALDAGREKEAKPAPPLIPWRFVKEVAWEERKRSIPSIIKLHNGWELTFYSSKGSPPNGIDIDLLWIDEEIENEAWWPEMVARLLDRQGKAMWSATPQVASEHLFNLHLRAEEVPDLVGEHIALLEDNPHIPQAEKIKLESRLASDEERRVRIKGEFAMTGFKIYPEFHPDLHNFDLRSSFPGGVLPADWARFIAIDPGRQTCAVLFAAVPPPSYGRNMLLLYDELYLKNCDAEAFASAMRSKKDGVQPEVFLIDHQAGRISEMGSGKTVESQYSEALKKHGVRSARTGHGFVWGAADPTAGILSVHEYLRNKEDGKPSLFIALDRMKHFKHEIERYHYKKVNKLVSDTPDKKHDHLMDCLRYITMYRPKWTKPRPVKKPVNYAVKAMRRKAERAKIRGEGSGRGVNLGPGR